MVDDPWTGTVLAFAVIGVVCSLGVAVWQWRRVLPLGLTAAAVGFAPSWAWWTLAGVAGLLAAIALSYWALWWAAVSQRRAMVVIASLLVVAVVLAK